jgi:hypothetical protein
MNDNDPSDDDQADEMNDDAWAADMFRQLMEAGYVGASATMIADNLRFLAFQEYVEPNELTREKKQAIRDLGQMIAALPRRVSADPQDDNDDWKNSSYPNF